MTGKILLVDDDPTIADLLAVILRSKGYEVLTAYCGEEALKTCRCEALSLLISDVNMPGLTGIELVRSVHGDFPKIRCILMSGGTDFDDQQMQQKLFALDIYATFKKPFNVAQFLAAVRSAMAP